ncbi:MAG: lipopolysaccharide heptosyltransferase II [Gammaproteobacteria bacterium]|nr:lipopolysaccharide heptosyltransferase II [Gammaproteobacteria bacterium]
MTVRFLVAGPNWVGDLVIADTLFKLIKQNHSDATLDLIAPPWARPLCERIAEVDRIFNSPGGHGRLAPGARWKLARELRKNHYTQAWVLPRSAKAALLPWMAGAARRSGYRGEMRYGLLTDIRRRNPDHYALAKRYAALAFAPGEALPQDLPRPVLQSSATQRQAAISRLGIEEVNRAVVLAPGAEYGPAKRWPIDKFAELAARLVAEGRPVWVVGGKGERALGEAIRARAPAARNLAGETALGEAIDVIAAASAVVTNDSGLMHVAAAVGTPLVAIYGSTSPDYTPPASETAKVVYHALPCSPCFERVCPLGHTNCLRSIGVEEVSAELDELPKKNRA